MTLSYTAWQRLEPSPRTPEIARALAAEVHDPLWFLARQWQLGELRGEDAGSIAWADLRTQSAMAAAWGRDEHAAGHRLLTDTGYPRMPLERAILEELPDGRELALKVELGQTFEAFLREERLEAGESLVDQHASELAARLRQRFSLAAASARDEEERAFLTVCGAMSIDGVRLFDDARRGDLWRALEWQPSRAELGAAGRFRAYVERAHAGLVGGDPPAWHRESVAYDAAVVLRSPEREAASLRVKPLGDGSVDWASWESIRTSNFEVGRRRKIIPGNLRFRGMPNARFWDFETAETDFGRVRADRRDLGRLAVLDMALVHGNDWYLIPFPMAVGTACRVESLQVRDVFGQTIPILPAETYTEGWSMFTTSREAGGLAPYFHLPASAAFTMQQGPTVEEVRFLLDEVANLGWAIEETVCNGLGVPHSARERSEAQREPATGLARTSTSGETGNPVASYQLQTDVPAFWYPLVAEQTSDRRVQLRLGVFRTSIQEPTPPDGRILEPLGSFLVDKNSIPDEGLRVLRRRMFSRWIDGSLHVWTQRVVLPAANSGSSGLRYDFLRWDRPAGSGATSGSGTT